MTSKDDDYERLLIVGDWFIRSTAFGTGVCRGNNQIASTEWADSLTMAKCCTALHQADQHVPDTRGDVCLRGCGCALLDAWALPQDLAEPLQQPSQTHRCSP